MESTSQPKQFSKIRNLLFPIYKHEFKKFIPLSLIFLIISYNYAVLRNLKDILVLINASAESIYYIKLAVVPSVVIYTILYSRLTRLQKENITFNTIIIFFLAFYFCFLIFFLPHLEFFQLDRVADQLNFAYPNFKGLWEAIRFWPISLFYINAESWGTFCLSILFWTFTNKITNIKQSERFYGLFAIGANVGLFIAGISMKYLCNDSILYTIIIMGVLLLILYNVFIKKIDQNRSAYEIPEKIVKKKKVKMSFKESFNFLVSSRYLLLIALLVLSYGMVISLFESVFKSQVDKLFKSSGSDQTFLKNIYSNQSFITSLTTVILIFFLSGPIRKRGWKFTASVTPIIAMVLSTLFFAFIVFGDQFNSITEYFNMNALTIGVFLGLGNVCFIKAAKYTLFDPTKEQTYIPLDEELKVRGKAAVDGVGARLGKSLGSLILTTILVPFFGDGKIDNVKQYVLFVIIAIIILWLISIHYLSIRFNELVKSTEKDKEEKQG